VCVLRMCCISSCVHFTGSRGSGKGRSGSDGRGSGSGRVGVPGRVNLVRSQAERESAVEVHEERSGAVASACMFVCE
jgi:hypothetical protein